MPRGQRVLEGVWAKLDRAQLHIQDVEAMVAVSLRGETPAIGLRREVDGSSLKVFAQILRPPPSALALCVGDALQNLRSSLDHLVYSLAVAGTRQDPPPDEHRLQFPITETKAE